MVCVIKINEFKNFRSSWRKEKGSKRENGEVKKWAEDL
jgi:hypothetical protein